MAKFCAKRRVWPRLGSCCRRTTGTGSRSTSWVRLTASSPTARRVASARSTPTKGRDHERRRQSRNPAGASVLGRARTPDGCDRAIRPDPGQPDHQAGAGEAGLDMPPTTVSPTGIRKAVRRSCSRPPGKPLLGYWPVGLFGSVIGLTRPPARPTCQRPGGSSADRLRDQLRLAYEAEKTDGGPRW
jgi:hypothetical protein